MIGRLNGKLVEKQPPQIVIDVGGVGYEVDVSMQTFYTLPPLGEPVQLFTQLVVREDAHLLFGFGSAQERATFRITVRCFWQGAMYRMPAKAVRCRGSSTPSRSIQAEGGRRNQPRAQSRKCAGTQKPKRQG